MPGMVTVTDEHGNATEVPEDQVGVWADRGFHAEGSDERANRIATQTRTEAEGTAAPVVTGILRGATFGLSDVAARAMGGDEARIQLQHLEEDAPGKSLLGTLGGSLVTGGAVGRLGKAVSEGFGGGIAGRIAGGAAEGGIYGTGNAVSQLAMSDDPLTAEHIASTLSSNVLLGGAIGGAAGGVFAAGEKALTKAGAALREAAATRGAIEGIPEDLAGLDEAGLRKAAQEAKVAHQADIAAERRSLEEIRVNQRAELANQVHDMHTALAEESPIFHAVNGEDVGKIEGVKDIRVQLAKSFKTMRAQFDNPIGIQRDPMSLVRPLEMRQTALESLQAKAPELQAALVGDARGAALEHVDTALEQTKQQIAAIRTLKESPLASGRLTALESAPSERMVAIDAAREALKRAPELGVIGKGVKGAVFGGATALAHMIPGVGVAAPFLGKYAADTVGKLFEHLAGGASAVAEKQGAAIKTLLGTAERAAPAVKQATTATATKVLGAVKFGEGEAPKSGKLGDLAMARMSEIRSQTEYAQDGTLQMKPAARQALAAKLAPIAAVNPLLADKIETVQARKTIYMSSKAPKRPEIGGIQIGPDKWRPSDLECRSWARTVRACEDPGSVEQRLAQGVITPEESEAYRTVYPERFHAMQMTIVEQLPTLSRTLPMRKKIALSVFTGVPMIPALQPNVLKVLQSHFAAEPGTAGGTQAPKPMPSFGALGSMKDLDKPTTAQARGD